MEIVSDWREDKELGGTDKHNRSGQLQTDKQLDRVGGRQVGRRIVHGVD